MLGAFPSFLRAECELVGSILHSLRHPGLPPKGFKTAGVAGLGVLIAGVVAIYACSPNFNDAFLEGQSGTYFSVGYLFIDSLSCIVIARCLLVTPSKNDRWRIPFAMLTAAMLAIAALAIAMVALGDSWFDRRSYFLKPDRFGRKFARAVLGTLVFGLVLCWRCPKGSFARFWLLLGFLLFYLALDDLMGFHEDAATLIAETIMNLPHESYLAKHLNDWFIVAYGVVALGLAWLFRRNFSRLPWTIWTFLVGFLAFAVTIVADFAHLSRWFEETAKLLAGSIILTGLITAWLEQRRPHLRQSRTELSLLQ